MGWIDKYEKAQRGKTVSKEENNFGSDLYTRMMNMVTTYGGSAVGDAVNGISPEAADWLEKYSGGMVPHTSEEMLAANRGSGKNKLEQAGDAANSISLGVTTAGIGKTAAPYISKAVNKIAKAIGTEEGLLSNTYKINPLAYKPNPESYYRTIGNNGYQDSFETGILRANPTGSRADPVLGINMSRPSDVPYFAKGEIGNYPGKEIVAEVNKPLYKRGDINPVTNEQIKGRHWGYRNIDESGTAANINIDDVKFLQKDWLKGYKEVARKTDKAIKEFKKLPFNTPNTKPTSGPLSKEMEPWLSKYEKPISKEEEIFESFLSPTRQEERLQSRTINLDRYGNIIKYQNGGIIEDDRGQWAHPGEVTKINSNDITMQGVDYPVLGVSDTGDTKMMQPGEDYKFEGNSVTEYPQAQNGKTIELDAVHLKGRQSPAWKAYKDSLSLYERENKTKNFNKKVWDYEPNQEDYIDYSSAIEKIKAYKSLGQELGSGRGSVGAVEYGGFDAGGVRDGMVRGSSGDKASFTSTNPKDYTKKDSKWMQSIKTGYIDEAFKNDKIKPIGFVPSNYSYKAGNSVSKDDGDWDYNDIFSNYMPVYKKPTKPQEKGINIKSEGISEFNVDMPEYEAEPQRYKDYNISDEDRRGVESRDHYRKTNLRPNGKPYPEGYEVEPVKLRKKAKNGLLQKSNKSSNFTSEDYKFKGESVTEYPMAQNGGQWLDKYQNGGTVSEVWQQKTGTGWADAKEQGLTDGSYANNIKLLGDLNKGTYDKKTEAPVDKPMQSGKSEFSGATFKDAFKQARESLGANRIFSYDGKSYGTNVAGEEFNPPAEDLEKFKMTSSVKKRVSEENKKVKSPFVSKDNVELEPTFKPWETVKKEKEEINKMSQADVILSAKRKSKNKDNFVIIDKAKGLAHVYGPNSDEPLYSSAIDIGAEESDAQTVTKIDREAADTNKDGIISDAEAAKGKADFSKGNKSTGAGRYKVSNLYPEGYYGLPLINLTNEAGQEVATSFHKGFIDDNNARVSNGCIRCKPKDLKYLVENLKPDTEVFVLPEDEGNSFVYENGQLNFNSQSDKDYDNYTDSRGVDRKGQGVNRTQNTLNYKPIKMHFNEKAFKEDKFDWYDFNDEKELNSTVKPYISSLESSKKQIMQLAQVNGDIYNEVAQTAFGIFGVESDYGDTNSYATNALMGIRKKISPKKGAPDTAFESSWREDDDQKNWNSLGLTQVVWNQLSKQEVSKLKELNINKIEDFNNPVKAARGTALILALRYNNEIKGKLEGDIQDLLSTRWNKGKGYTDRVRKSKRFIDLSQLD